MSTTKILIETSLGAKSLKEIAEETGIGIGVIRNRYYRGMRGDALLQPLLHPRDIIVSYKGREMTLKQAAEEFGISKNALSLRYRDGKRGDELFAPLNEKKKADRYIGRKYNKLTILAISYRKPSRAFAVCRCECGKETEVGLYNVINGVVKSCGCSKKPSMSNLRHGMSKSREHKSWAAMKERCYNPNHRFYKNYGGRGIGVCEEWRDSFDAFYRDMGPRPNGCSLDRINNDKDYSSENCRWASSVEQNNNRRNVLQITARGKMQTPVEWARELNCTPNRIRDAFNKGRDMEKYFDAIEDANRRGSRKIRTSVL